MDHSFRQELYNSQKQQLALSPAMLLSLEVLHMPLQELQAMLTQRIYENPMLEMDEDATEEGSEEFAPISYEQVKADVQHAEALDEGENSFEFKDTEIWKKGPGSETADAMAVLSHSETFGEMLKSQVGTQHLAEGEAALCIYIIDCLDTRGYLEIAPEVISEETGVPLFEVMQALYIVQSLHPPGVGARTLEECLVLQLVEGPHFSGDTIKLVREGLPLLAAGDEGGIAALLGTGTAAARTAMAVVRALTPIPSRGYHTGEEATTIVPDAQVEKTEDGFRIVMNRQALPKLALSREYQAIVGTTGEAGAETYLKERLADAKTLLRAVQAREDNLTLLVDYVTRHQQPFFENGGPLSPMTMTAVAAELGVHPSTISRTVQGKYIKCAAGTLPLKALFVSGVANRQGENISQPVIKDRIARFIAAEDAAHPLSDEDIRLALAAVGIDVARRTVAKYREELGLPSSSRRRRR